MIEAIWTGRGKRARVTRTLLAPAAALYRAVVVTRGKLYDWGLFRAKRFSVPVLSVGNLSVGGTGKTPVAAWFARRFAEMGSVPAIVLRGYGGDEIIFHQWPHDGVSSIAVALSRAPWHR